MEAPAGKAVSVDSKVPFVLEVTAQKVDADPVLFAYAYQTWAYADVAHQCNFGKYDSGNPEGDCGFSCRWEDEPWPDELACLFDVFARFFSSNVSL